MPKTTTQAEKDALLAKMERDRAELADAFARAATHTKTSSGWASTTALAAGAVIGWPRFLKKPMRAMAAVALRDRFSNVLKRRHQRRADSPAANAEVDRLAQLTTDLRQAIERVAPAEEVEHIRRELDDQVRRIRELKALETTPGQTLPR
ncbi:hypothetical protein [Bordetella genomosp. 4]|uniref:Uncharacterized protein n=1 Tax=Bordetella genomosp. 4 TaxID=463044 RepID=A0A261U3T5_9BORD|nr:hypothetical protein [Bordetella genomosp. 4]OZI49835.1 hypothetical protein CAL21_09770 [Bordetella genomosp. 4]OZI56275.1 hypothetical protein CAL20_12605 [Bordetella genomosp. 4]